MTISISPRGLTEEEGKRWNRLFTLDPIRVIAHSEIADMAARGVSIGRIAYDHANPPSVESVWDPPFDSPVPNGPGGIVNAPLLNGENEVRITLEREGEESENPEVATYTLSAEDGLAAKAFLKENDDPFPPFEGETLWVAESFLSGTWSTKAKLPVNGPFDPGKLVLPFAACTSASGKTYRFLLLDRAKYDGMPLDMEFCDWTKTGFSTGPVIDVWREGTDGKRPYYGPWSGMEEPNRDDKIDGNYWASLLIAQSRFADRCPWHKIPGLGWARLLSAQPQFADKCDWSLLNGSHLAKLFAAQPQFANDRFLRVLDGIDWANLLRARPEFADKCDWDKLGCLEWSRLLAARPEFASRCDWDKFDGVMADRAWVELLAVQPQFADRCDWSKFDSGDWAYLLEAQPQFADRCDLNALSADDLWKVLEKRPSLGGKVDWSRVDGSCWAALLSHQPEFADKCDWSKLYCEDWVKLLTLQPQFADRCDRWGKFDGGDWVKLLTGGWFGRAQPQFAEKCDWSKLDVDDWMKLLMSQPQFADKCGCWAAFNGRNLVNLLWNHPEFAPRCDWSKLDGDDWSSLLQRHPEFADKCVWKKRTNG